MIPTKEQAAQGWRGTASQDLPPVDVLVEIKGSDFMGDWYSTAKSVWVKRPKKKHPNHRIRVWRGEGMMAFKSRPLERGDVEMWRFIPEKKEGA